MHTTARGALAAAPRGWGGELWGASGRDRGGGLRQVRRVQNFSGLPALASPTGHEASEVCHVTQVQLRCRGGQLLGPHRRFPMSRGGSRARSGPAPDPKSGRSERARATAKKTAAAKKAVSRPATAAAAAAITTRSTRTRTGTVADLRHGRSTAAVASLPAFAECSTTPLSTQPHGSPQPDSPSTTSPPSRRRRERCCTACPWRRGGFPHE